VKIRAIAYIVLAGLLWGTSGIFVRFLEPYGTSPMQMTFVRGFVAAVAVGIYILITNKSLFKIKKENIPFYIGSGICILLTAVLYYSSMQKTSVATSVILMYMAPVYVMIYSVLFLKEKFTFLKGIAIVLMLIGCALVSGVAGGLKYDLAGILLGILSGITYGAYSIITKIEMQRQFNSLSATFYCYFVMAVISMCVSRPVAVFSVAASSWQSMFLMIGLGIFTFALPYFLYNLGLQKIPAGTASSLAVVEPLAATFYSTMFFNEPLDVFSIVGFISIVVSVIMLSRAD